MRQVVSIQGKKKIPEIRILRDKFQEKVKNIVGDDYLQSTCETWNPGGRPYPNMTKNV